MLKKGIKNLGFVLAFVLVIIVISNLFAPQKSVYEPVYSDLIKDIEARRVKEIVVKDSEIEVTYKDKSRKVEKIEAPGKYILENETVQQLMAENKLKVTVPKPEEGSWLVSMLPTVITFVIIIAFWIFAFRQSQGGGKGMSGFGKSKAKSPDENGKRVTFADVAGVDEEKKELS